MGYYISDESMSPDQLLIDKILKVEVPKNKKELESFSGLVNFYRQYVEHYSKLTDPFDALKKKSKSPISRQSLRERLWGDKSSVHQDEVSHLHMKSQRL